MDEDLNLTSKEVTGQNAPVGAALVAQAMNSGDASMRYKATQAVKDWDRTRLVAPSSAPSTSCSAAACWLLSPFRA